LAVTALHAAHAAPPPPHCANVAGVTHALPAQQPPGHDAGLHTHAPAMHC
jgi:hypothetical protein